MILLFIGITSHVRSELLPTITYTVADGLLRDNVYRIRQDSRGYLWFCSSEGITRFDGYTFLNFTTDDGLPDRHVNDIVETKTGRYLIATDVGISELKPKGVRNSSENPLFHNYILFEGRSGKASVFLKRQNGDLLAGTEFGLFRIADDSAVLELERFDFTGTELRPNGIQVTSLIETRAGDLLVGTTSGGVFRLSASGESTNYSKSTELPSNNITSILEDKNGLIWVGSRPDKLNDGGLSLIKSETQSAPGSPVATFTKKDGFPSNWITTVFETSAGEIWIGTTGGLCKWQGAESKSVCRLYTERNGLCDMEVWTIDEDRDGNLWTGTRCGVSKKSQAGFTSFTRDDGLPITLVNSMFEDSDGTFYTSVNFPARLVSRYTDSGFATVNPNFPADLTDFGWGWKQTVLKDSVGDWWFPSKEGLYVFRNARSFGDLAAVSPEHILVGEARGEVFRIFEDSRRDVWVATTNPSQLFRWERSTGNWRDHSANVKSGPNRIVTAFTEDRLGNLWIASGEAESALIKYRDGDFLLFDQSDGIPGGWTKDVFVDREGRIWLATANDGLVRIDNPNDEVLKIQKYTTADGLASNGSYCITEDEFGRIYVGSGRGLDRIDPTSGQIENFTSANGLPDSNVEIAYRDRHNALWFSTPKGLARLMPEPSKPRTPPVVLISAVRVNGVAKSVSILGETTIDDLALNSDERQLEIDFVGLGSNLGEKMRYEYRVGGEEWTKTNESSLGLVNLAPGDYRFEIRAVTADRIHSENPAILSFRIASPLWQRWWFISSVIALAALVFYGFYRNRVNKLLELERTRTRIATDLHDDIGSNLSKISLLSEIVNLQFAQENQKTNPMLTTIAEISRESVSSMSDIVWAINPQRDSFPELTRRMRSYAEGIFVEKGVRVVFDTNAETEQVKLSMNVRRDLYLIFKEAVNNAAKHSGCDGLHVTFKLDDREIVLRVRDNGDGFDTEHERDGNGLLNMKRRAEANGGRISISSTLGEGTEIIVRFASH